MNYTPGPWTAHDDDGTGTAPCVLSEHVNVGGSFYVAQCNNFTDARLIAAAPDLLEALQQAVLGDERYKWAPQARAAIAKATGEAG